MNEFGPLLDEAWKYKKMMSPKISSDEIEEIYAEARKHGALGGKLSGAGFMLLYCEFDRKHKVANALNMMGKEVLGVAFDPHGLQTWRVSP